MIDIDQQSILRAYRVPITIAVITILLSIAVVRNSWAWYGAAVTVLVGMGIVEGLRR